MHVCICACISQTALRARRALRDRSRSATGRQSYSLLRVSMRRRTRPKFFGLLEGVLHTDMVLVGQPSFPQSKTSCNPSSGRPLLLLLLGVLPLGESGASSPLSSRSRGSGRSPAPRTRRLGLRRWGLPGPKKSSSRAAASDSTEPRRPPSSAVEEREMHEPSSANEPAVET